MAGQGGLRHDCPVILHLQAIKLEGSGRVLGEDHQVRSLRIEKQGKATGGALCIEGQVAGHRHRRGHVEDQLRPGERSFELGMLVASRKHIGVDRLRTAVLLVELVQLQRHPCRLRVPDEEGIKCVPAEIVGQKVVFIDERPLSKAGPSQGLGDLRPQGTDADRGHGARVRGLAAGARGLRTRKCEMGCDHIEGHIVSAHVHVGRDEQCGSASWQPVKSADRNANLAYRPLGQERP